ncbi:IS481 family transposase [Dermatophilaceae bacterium Sec6.4]
MSHRNSPLSPTGRLRLARCVVEDGWPLRRAADRFAVSVTTAKRWADRYRQHGQAGMVDRSSRPCRCAHRTSRRGEHRVVGLRVSRRWGPARIAYHLGMNVSTVQRVLARYRCVRLSWTDPATGVPVRARRRQVRRYERDAPGDLVHVDIKKLGRIPDGGGHRIHGRAQGTRNSSAHREPGRARKAHGRPNLGYAFLHHAVDDHSRYTYSEILTDEKKETARDFMARALEHFASVGITTARVMTDNGSCYRSKIFGKLLADRDIKHKRTRPYRPQTNGKVERFNRTLQEEWAYARPYTSETERVAAFPQFLHTYNHHRGHTALKGDSPADRVPNLAGQYN